MMSYINETDFVIENKELVYPEIVTDGLQLYYDAKGKRDTDYHRDTMLDMSGNENHGKLQNFAYEKHSGYKDGLVFDYIDDKLVRPELDLNPNDFTFMLNGNIISFSPDGTVKRVQDGEVIESKGLNMLYDMEGTSSYGLDVIYNYNHAQASWVDSSRTNTFLYSTSKYNFKDKHKYYISYNAKPDGNVRLRIYANERYLDGDIFNPIINEYNFRSGIVEAENQYSNIFNVRLLFGSDSVIGTKIDIKDLMIIDLTESFGAGNEPTKEQMDKIIERFGFIPNAQDLIDRIEYKGNDLGDMENIIDGLYKTEVLSGQELYTTEPDDAVVHVEVDGKSYQHAGSGKNIAPNGTLNHSGYGFLNEYHISFAKSDESFIPDTKSLKITHLNGANDGSQMNRGYRYDPRGLSIGTSYVYSFYGKGFAEKTSGVGWYTERVGGTKHGMVDIGGGWTRYWIRFIPGTDTPSIYVRPNSNQDYDFDVLVNGIQLEEGSSMTDYELPAPTPDYPIEIHSLNDFDVVSSVGKENLIGGSNTIKGGWIISTGALLVQANLPRVASDFIEVVPGSDMVFTYDGFYYTTSSTQKVMGVYDKDKIFIERLTSSTTNKVWKIKLNSQAKFVRIAYGASSSEYDNYAKLEAGSESTPWNYSHKDLENNLNNNFIDKINLLLDEPLRSVGDAKDKLFRDSDGIWKIERNIRERILNGRENWSAQSDGSYYTSFSGKKIDINTNLHSDRFMPVISIDGAEQLDIGRMRNTISNTNVIFYFDKGVGGPANFKSWLSANNTKVYYELANSTIETLDEELQDKLNNLRSFEGSNYIYTVPPNENNYLSENLTPTLHAKFLYNNWYKEDRVINNLMIYNRALTNEEMLQNYKTIKRRWGM